MVENNQRPWGYYLILADEKDHKVKRIIVYPNKRLSLQRHKYRAEHWYILTGEAQVTLDDKVIILKEKEAIDIPLAAIHRVANKGDKNLVFIEVQTGTYFGEDDIERLEDDFGRMKL